MFQALFLQKPHAKGKDIDIKSALLKTKDTISYGIKY